MAMLLSVPPLDPPPIPAPILEVAVTDPPLMVMLLPVFPNPPPIPAPILEVAVTNPPLMVMSLPLPLSPCPPPIPAPKSEVAVTDPPLMVMLLPLPPCPPPIPAPKLAVAINFLIFFEELSKLSIVSLAALSFCKAASHSLLSLLIPSKYM